MEKGDSSELNSTKGNKKRNQIYSNNEKRKQRKLGLVWTDGLDDERDRLGPPAQATESGRSNRKKKGKNHRNRRAKELEAKNKNQDETVDSVKLEDETDASIEKATTGKSVKHDDDGTGDCSD